MYCQHWELRHSPFFGGKTASWIYRSPTHAEALARMHFLVEQRRRLGCLSGPAGSGKSLLLNTLGRELASAGARVATIDLVGLSTDEMLPQLASGWRIESANLSAAQLWQALADQLAVCRYENRAAIALFDNGQLASQEALTQVARLVLLDRHDAARLTVVVACRSGSGLDSSEALSDLCELRMELEPWNEGDVTEFLKAALSRAGGRIDLFDEGSIEALARLAKGIPRRVAQLADLCLVVGAARGAASIDADVVASVARELAPARVAR